MTIVKRGYAKPPATSELAFIGNYFSSLAKSAMGNLRLRKA